MATHTDSVAQVYAKSLYELAQEAGGESKIQEINDELEQICELARGDRALAEFLRSPIIDKGTRSDSLRKVLSDRVTDLTLRFLLVLNDKGRLGHLEQIAGGFDSLVQDAFGRVEVDVFTPGPLGAEQRDRIKDRIKAALGREPILYEYTDPTMIGGIRLRIGDQLIDASVATQLRRIRDQLVRDGGSALRDRMNDIIDDAGTSSA